MNHLDDARLAALARGADPDELEATHLLECAPCRSRIDARLDSDASTSERMSDVLGVLRDTGALDEKAEARVLASLENIASRERRKRLVLRAGAIVAALAIAAGISLVMRPRAHVSAGTIDLEHATAYPMEGARVAVTSPGQDERVSLEGTAEFSVRKLLEGHRFRVVMGDDEVEVRGTKFRLTGGAGGLSSLDVEEGRVEVRSRCCGQASVVAGGHWSPTSGVTSPSASGAPMESVSSASNTSALPSSEPAPSDASSDPSAPAPDADPTSPADSPARAREWMTQGRQAFDDGKFGAASTLLDRALIADPGATWAKDARVLSGAARVLSAPLSSVASMGVGVASFDVAARQASRRGDAKRAALARLGAARRTPGDAGKKRWCQLVSEGALDAAAKAEARSRCGP